MGYPGKNTEWVVFFIQGIFRPGEEPLLLLQVISTTELPGKAFQALLFSRNSITMRIEDGCFS